MDAEGWGETGRGYRLVAGYRGIVQCATVGYVGFGGSWRLQERVDGAEDNA